MRLFVAVRPPAEVVDALRALPRPPHRGLRWASPAQWHVTLRFLGELDDPAAAAAAVAAVPRRTRVGRPVAQVGPETAWFPGRRVLQLPVAGLDALAAAVAEATASFVPEGGPPFTGHLTVARGRGLGPGPAEAAGASLTATFEVGEVHLLASRPGPGGPVHDLVARVPLVPPDGA